MRPIFSVTNARGTSYLKYVCYAFGSYKQTERIMWVCLVDAVWALSGGALFLCSRLDLDGSAVHVEVCCVLRMSFCDSPRRRAQKQMYSLNRCLYLSIVMQSVS